VLETRVPSDFFVEETPVVQTPDFIIGGAGKSATTWLLACMSEHPDVFVYPREINFFSWEYDRGLEWYASHFEDAKSSQTIGEKSNSYFVSPDAPERLHRWNSDVELVFVLRDPVARAYSHYCMLLRAEEVSDAPEDEIVPGTRFIEDSLYATNLERFYEHFDASQIHVVLMEQLKSDSGAFIEDVYRAVGVDPDFEPSLVGERFHQKRPRPRFLRLYRTLVRWANWLARRSSLAQLVVYWLRRSPLTAFFHRLNEGPDFREMSEEFERKLAEFVRPEMERLSERLDRDVVELWLEPYLEA